MGSRSRAISALNYDEYMIIYDELIEFRWQSYILKETYVKNDDVKSYFFLFYFKEASTHLSILGISARLE